MPWQIDKAQHIGGREEQQDRVEVLGSQDDQRHLLVVADGMGGHQGGGMAAQAVVESATQRFFAGPVSEPQEFLEEICLAAHWAIREITATAERSPGSTCALLYLDGAEAYWAHVGDSRVYHFRGGELMDRTQDHTLVELMVAEGRVRECDPEAKALQNQLYMRLGGEKPPEPDFEATVVESGDLFLVCSDGFWCQVVGDDLVSGLGGCALEIGEADRLVNRARERGGSGVDNISLVLARWCPEKTKGVREVFRRAFGSHRKGE